MATIRWTLSAADDLEAIGTHIARDSAVHAMRMIDRIVDSTERLRPFPESGRIVPEFRRGDLRELIVRGYRVVYLLRQDEVIVLRVVYGSREFVDALGAAPWNVE